MWRGLAPLLMVGWSVLMLGACMKAGSMLHTSVAPLYTVAALREQLARQPASVVGRTLAVQGIVQNCGPGDAAPAYCLAPVPRADPAEAIDPFPVAWAQPAPLRRWLAGLPLLGRLVHVGRPVFPDQAGTYPLRLRMETNKYCGEPVCYEALLLDAAPPP
jgi:hypothetical protein